MTYISKTSYNPEVIGALDISVDNRHKDDSEY